MSPEQIVEYIQQVRNTLGEVKYSDPLKMGMQQAVTGTLDIILGELKSIIK